MICNKFPEICLKEFRHNLQQRADILNIFYDGKYSINDYIWLIINERNNVCYRFWTPTDIFSSRWLFAFTGSCQQQNQGPLSICFEHSVYYRLILKIEYGHMK
jgi:hypothetical protein